VAGVTVLTQAERLVAGKRVQPDWRRGSGVWICDGGG
jgi:hypothetical protein